MNHILTKFCSISIVENNLLYYPPIKFDPFFYWINDRKRSLTGFSLNYLPRSICTPFFFFLLIFFLFIFAHIQALNLGKHLFYLIIIGPRRGSGKYIFWGLGHGLGPNSSMAGGAHGCVWWAGFGIKKKIPLIKRSGSGFWDRPTGQVRIWKNPAQMWPFARLLFQTKRERFYFWETEKERENDGEINK